MKKISTILSLIILCLFLSACISDEEKAKASELVDKYQDNFENRAKLQYGENVIVTDINADFSQHWNTVWPTYQMETTGNLKGIITADETSFDAMYFTNQDEIFSRKNIKIISDSIGKDIKLPKLNILDSSLKNGEHETPYLPDEIKSFDSLISSQFYTQTKIYTQGDLSVYTEKNFSIILNKTSDFGTVVIIQLNDISYLDELKRIDQEIAFDGTHTIYDNENRSYVDAIEKYNIENFIYLKYDEFVLYRQLNKSEYRYFERK
jgi:hypothetical protein